MVGLNLSPLKRIANPKGDVFHVLKKSDKSFKGFGEVYFSSILFNEMKGWRQHTEMTLNIVVAVGEIQFFVYDQRDGSETKGCLFTVNLSKENYQLLTVEPGLWVAFKGLGSGENMLLNCSDIEHRPEEAISKHLDEIKFQ